MLDLCLLLSPCGEHERAMQSSHQYPLNTRFRFPSQYNGRSQHKELVHAIQRQAILGGFVLSTCKTSSKKETINRVMSTMLKCQFGQLYAGKPKSFSNDIVTKDGVKPQSTNKENQAKHNRHKFNKCLTKRPIDSDAICPFSLVIFLAHDDYWYLATKTGKCSSNVTPSLHQHHSQQDPELMPTMTRNKKRKISES
jgi:hypothetical protein